MGDFAVILPAAGRSTRFGGSGRSKIEADLAGRAVWLRALDPFLNRDDVAQVIVAISPGDRERFEGKHEAFLAFHRITLVDGGAERHDTVARALKAVDSGCLYVAIHDAARPCVDSALIDAVFHAARQFGAAVPGVAVADTLKRVDDSGMLVATVPRAGLVAVQTPQAFRRDLLDRAYADPTHLPGVTDDAQLMERLGAAVRHVVGTAANLKITVPDDLRLAEALLARSQPPEPPRPRHPFFDEEGL